VTSIPRSDTSLRVVAGSLIALRMYDIAYAIDLDRVEQIGTAQAQGASRIGFSRAEPKAIAYGVPPVEIRLGQVPLELPNDIHFAEASVRIYEFGAISISLRVPIRDVTWDAFAAASLTFDRSGMSGPGAAVFNTLAERVLALLAPALDRPAARRLEEDYFLSVVQTLDPPLGAEELLEQVDLAGFLAGERAALSDGARRDILRNRFSYLTTDLAVLAWDNAFLFEPSGDLDVADVLEVANAQLLELRFYDDLLDRELPRMYDRVAETRNAFRGLSRRRYAGLARDLYTLVAEVTETTERVDNALKVTEDVYLARIYGAALELFRVPTWAGAVDRKLSIIRDTYTALYDEAATARAELIELGIFLLIVFEIVMAFLA
jgi:hypothetical protein